jgi:hypothetical protein
MRLWVPPPYAVGKPISTMGKINVIRATACHSPSFCLSTSTMALTYSDEVEICVAWQWQDLSMPNSELMIEQRGVL